MRFVQILVTDDQAELVAAALRDAEKSLGASGHPGDIGGEPEILEDIDQLGRLSMLFQDASENPSKYPPTGKAASTVRSIVRRTKVPQPVRPRNKRKQRQAAKQKFQMFDRQTRRAIAEGYNKARQMYEDEAAEHARNVAEVAERVKDQPKFKITDGFGNIIMGEIPAEFILDAEGISLDSRKGKIVLPPRVTGAQTVDERSVDLARLAGS